MTEARVPMIDVPVGLDEIEAFVRAAMAPNTEYVVQRIDDRGAELGSFGFRSVWLFLPVQSLLRLSFEAVDSHQTRIWVHSTVPPMFGQSRRGIVHRFFVAVEDEIKRRA